MPSLLIPAPPHRPLPGPAWKSSRIPAGGGAPELNSPLRGEVEADAFRAQRTARAKSGTEASLAGLTVRSSECKAGMRIGDGPEGAPGHSYTAPRNRD